MPAQQQICPCFHFNNNSPAIPWTIFLETVVDSNTTVEQATGSRAHLAWTLQNRASACFLKLGAENCEMCLPVCYSLSTRAVMQNRTANNGEKTLIRKLITLLNKQQRALENDSVTHLFRNNLHLHNIKNSAMCKRGEQIFINKQPWSYLTSCDEIRCHRKGCFQ